MDILLLPETSDVPTIGRPAVWQGLSPCPARFSEMRNSSRTGSSQNHMSRVEPQHSEKGEIFVLGLWGVRYQVEDVGIQIGPDLPARIEALQEAGVHFRNQMEVGPGGRQIQIEDPDGDPIELFEPAKR